MLFSKLCAYSRLYIFCNLWCLLNKEKFLNSILILYMPNYELMKILHPQVVSLFESILESLWNPH